MHSAVCLGYRGGYILRHCLRRRLQVNERLGRGSVSNFRGRLPGLVRWREAYFRFASIPMSARMQWYRDGTAWPNPSFKRTRLRRSA
jgi:hypothetical protein